MLLPAVTSQLGSDQVQYPQILLQIEKKKKGTERHGKKKFDLNRPGLFFV